MDNKNTQDIQFKRDYFEKRYNREIKDIKTFTEYFFEESKHYFDVVEVEYIIWDPTNGRTWYMMLGEILFYFLKDKLQFHYVVTDDLFDIKEDIINILFNLTWIDKNKILEWLNKHIYIDRDCFRQLFDDDFLEELWKLAEKLLDEWR